MNSREDGENGGRESTTIFKNVYRIERREFLVPLPPKNENKHLSSETNWKYYHEKYNRRNEGYNKLTG